MSRALLLLVLLFPILASAQPMVGHHHAKPAVADQAVSPIQTGQAGFAAIQEIVAILEADTTTDWTKVDVEALRQHLIDMDNVTLHADLRQESAEGGVVFIVSGSGRIRDSIRRMIMAHAATMNGVGGWAFVAATTEAGATMMVRVPSGDVAKLKGLGFIGVMSRGMHHQAHHLMIARGKHPHH